MTKDEIKLLCEDDADPLLRWWAMMLFAEISDIFHYWNFEDMDPAHFKVIKAKVDEFPRIVIQNALEAAKKKAAANRDDSEGK